MSLWDEHSVAGMVQRFKGVTRFNGTLYISGTDPTHHTERNLARILLGLVTVDGSVNVQHNGARVKGLGWLGGVACITGNLRISENSGKRLRLQSRLPITSPAG